MCVAAIFTKIKSAPMENTNYLNASTVSADQLEEPTTVSQSENADSNSNFYDAYDFFPDFSF